MLKEEKFSLYSENYEKSKNKIKTKTHPYNKLKVKSMCHLSKK